MDSNNIMDAFFQSRSLREEPNRELLLAYLKLMEKQLKVTLNELSITDERGE